MPPDAVGHPRSERRALSLELNVGPAERVISAVAGGLLLLDAVRRGGRGRAIRTVVGATLAWRGLTGHSPIYHELGISTAEGGDAATVHVRKMIHVQRGFTINRPAMELYDFWRRLENLPTFMEHLESVREIGDCRSRWVAEGPLGKRIEWDAEVTEDAPGRCIAWRSVEGSEVANSGMVRFAPAPGDRGTEVTVSLEYAPPAGAVGDVVARLLGGSPEQQINDDLRHFKQIAEAGEIPTTEGQSSGRME